MRGVKIVSRTETTKIIVDDETRPIPIILFLIFTVATTGVSIWGILSDPMTRQRTVAFIMAVAYFLVCTLLFSAYSTSVTKQSTYKYKVIVAEGTNMEEFHEKYEVLTQKGRVYEVVEK
ncbi:MAG: hypothetical protein IIY81_13655 [Lachnospiraceae bacterium]|nr:hypothetical protein [Lachnospiraceae bacterium]